MQKTFYLESEEEIFETSMKFLDECTIEDKIVIYINSGGGSCWKFDSILQRLEEMKQEWYKIVIRCIFVGSAAFDLFYKWTGEKILENEADWIIHNKASTANIMGNWKVRASDPSDRWRIEHSKTIKETEYHFTTEEENKKLEDGFDIYINPNRMKEIFV